jgi:hypothetical protein
MMARRKKSPDLVALADIRAAVAALEADLAAGRIGAEEAARRINNCRRAVTPRELWRASGHRAGSRRRSDWAEIRSMVFNLTALVIMLVLGVWLVTWALAQLHGSAP